MSEIAEVIARRIDEDATLSAESGLLVLAALEGDEALADMAGFARPEPVIAETDPTEPAGAYLQQISVRGFRGIGPAAELVLKPAPGLTIVAGRNGSGKSSFAEAVEVALTSTTYRWSNKASKQWREAWRNLHHPASTSIRVTLAEEDVGRTYVTADWADGADLDQLTSAVQRHGKPKESGLAGLGWCEAIEAYRPLLTYDELGALLTAEPSRLYDALSTVLGLDQIADAIDRLNDRHKDQSAPAKDIASFKTHLLRELSNLDDERAERATKLLKARNPDAADLRALATGTSQGADQSTDVLRRIANLTLPDAGIVNAAIEQLRAAVQALADAGDATTEALERRAALLATARSMHAYEGDVDCPICGEGRLDGSRAESLGQELTQIESLLVRLRAARDDLQSATGSARRLVDMVPAVLTQTAVPEQLHLLQQVAGADWAAWAAMPDGASELAEHLLVRRPTIAASLERLQIAARAELAKRDDAWAALASRLAGYTDQTEGWQRLKPEVDVTKAALDWLKAHDQALKNERLRPIADQAMGIWTALRQESNVEIAGLRLEGANTRRRVEIRSSVDGHDAAGITVLSQGELHALALALFLPRAAMADSPFRFVILDDPVQAMDPSKVDGLLKVLSTLAEKRQVVVFSHDDRLASAARRGGAEATILEVTRDEGSVVSVRETLDPADRYLQDARAMARDDKLPDDTKRRLLPGMLRLAVEARARDRYFSVALGSGVKPHDAEAAWDAALTTRSRVALAIFDDGHKDMRIWQGRGMHRGPALGVCASGFHEGMTGDVDGACYNVQKLIRDIADGAK